MKIPAKLKVGGHTYKVVITELEGDKFGDADAETNTIRIHSKAPPDQQGAAFIHEILCHTLAPTFGSTDLGHALLDSIAEGLYQVLADNHLLR